MPSGWFVTANDIKIWTDTNKRLSEDLLPKLVRKLICASCNPKYLHFPSGDSVAVAGWDGTLLVDKGNEFIPTGKSIWEFGTNRSVKQKANNDYQKRTDKPVNLSKTETTFVFVTSRTWKNKDEWCAEKNAEGIWHQVRGINADDLEHWLHQCPGIHRWFASLIGKRSEALWDIEQAWGAWRCSTSVPATYDLILNGREEQVKELLKTLKTDPAILRIRAISENEAYAFTIASLIKDEKLASKVLVVKDQSQWDILIDTQNTLILIPQNFNVSNIGYAKTKGHFIVIPESTTVSSTASKELKLEKMSRDNVIKALKKMGFSEDDARNIYGDTRGYLEPIRRHEKLGPQECIIPKWVDQFDASILIACLMATEWDGMKKGDKDTVSKLSNLPYEKFEEKVSELAATFDPPIRAVGSIWQVISKFDFWSLCAPKINRQSIDRLESILLIVLGESDPTFDINPKERWLANIKGAIPEFSRTLKSGLSDTVLMFAVFGDNVCSNLGDVNLAGRVSLWMRKIFNNDTSARGWYSLGSNLISLAEASPGQFLTAIETSLQGVDPPIAPIFQEEGDLGGCPHSNLLWALETISWSLDYLPRVTRVLARLSIIDPGGRYSNRPFASLRDIFLGWINNTRANHLERLQIIDANLVKFFPEVAWRLLLALLPGRAGDIASYIHKPKYRNWAEGITKKVKNNDYLQFLEGVADRIIKLFNDDPISRIPELVESLTQLPTFEKFIEIVDKLNEVNYKDLGDQVRLKTANELRSIISHYREFQNARGSWPKEHIDRLEIVYYYCLPEDPLLKHKYLFDDHFPDLIDPIVRKETDYQERQEIIENHRVKALKEIYKLTGIGGIENLANICDQPGFIGNAIVRSDLRKQLENVILEWLENENVRLAFLARSFVSACEKLDKDWVYVVLGKSYTWSQKKLVNFLMGLPFDQNTLTLVKNADKEVQEKYWKNLSFYFLKDDDRDEVNWVVEQLLKYGRPLAAIDAAAQVLHGSMRRALLDNKILATVLMKIATDPSDMDQTPFTKVRYDILQAIEYIQNQEELTRDEIAQIEWMYIGILRFDRVKPRYLEQELLKNPDFFVQVVTWIYKPDEGKREDESIGEESLKLRAQNAWELLSLISTIPGQQEDGSININKLKDWVFRAREQLENLKRKKIGEDQIGNLLSKSPPGTDGIWPHEAVREIIEELQSGELENAFGIGKQNDRGITSRSPFAGGTQERELAKTYRKQAEKIKLQWPRTSEVLRRLAKSYERMAELEDRDVELRS